MILAEFFKWPQDRLDYGIDCSRWLPADDRIKRIAITITGILPAGIDKDETPLILDDYEYDDRLIKIWLTQGSPYMRYHVECLIETAAGRQKQTGFIINMRYPHQHEICSAPSDSTIKADSNEW